MGLGDRGPRKGIETLLAAWFDAFPIDEYPDVRLIIKARSDSLRFLYNASFPDQRISIWREDIDRFSDALVHADCFVFPTYGEGWGMPPREAAAMGIPVIVTRHSGTEVGLDNWGYALDDYIYADPPLPYYGKWVVPSVSELVNKMQWVYENRVIAKQFGMQASKWLRQHQTWEHAAKRLVSLVEEHTHHAYLNGHRNSAVTA